MTDFGHVKQQEVDTHVTKRTCLYSASIRKYTKLVIVSYRIRTGPNFINNFMG